MRSASGTAAVATAVLSLVEPGDHVVAFDDLYAGTRRCSNAVPGPAWCRRGVRRCDDADAVAAAMTPATELVWVETPTNPRIKLCDIDRLLPSPPTTTSRSGSTAPSRVRISNLRSNWVLILSSTALLSISTVTAMLLAVQ